MLLRAGDGRVVLPATDVLCRRLHRKISDKIPPECFFIPDKDQIEGGKDNKLFMVGYACAIRKNSGIKCTFQDKLGMNPSQIGAFQNGQDAYFFGPYSFGIADGVGGWSRISGGDPALFSLLLMHYARKKLDRLISENPEPQNEEGSRKSVNLIEVLQESNDILKQNAVKLKARGSTTALVAVLTGDKMNIVNVGDSGVLVIRDGELIFKSKELLHRFNFPYQLGPESSDSPSDAPLQSLTVQRNDIIISGSDGLFDNLFIDDIVMLAREYTKKTQDSDSYPKALACAILEKIQAMFKSPRFCESPFEVRAKGAGFWNFRGPKPDDTTILINLVK